jgi:hypothetical protein
MATTTFAIPSAKLRDWGLTDAMTLVLVVDVFGGQPGEDLLPVLGWAWELAPPGLGFWFERTGGLWTCHFRVGFHTLEFGLEPPDGRSVWMLVMGDLEDDEVLQVHLYREDSYQSWALVDADNAASVENHRDDFRIGSLDDSGFGATLEFCELAFLRFAMTDADQRQALADCLITKWGAGTDEPEPEHAGTDAFVGWLIPSGSYVDSTPDPFYWCTTEYHLFNVLSAGTVTFRLYTGDSTYPGGTLVDTQVYGVGVGDTLEVAAASLYGPFYWTVDDGGGEVQFLSTTCGYSYSLKPYPDPLVVDHTIAPPPEEEQLFVLIFVNDPFDTTNPSPASDVVDDDLGLVLARRTGGGSNNISHTIPPASMGAIGSNSFSDITLTIQLRNSATHAVIESQTALFEFNTGMGWYLRRIAKDVRFYVRISSSAGGFYVEFHSRQVSTIVEATYPWAYDDHPDGIELVALDTGISEYSAWNGQNREKTMLGGAVTVTEADTGTVYSTTAPGDGVPDGHPDGEFYDLGAFYMRNRYSMTLPGASYTTDGTAFLPAERVNVWPTDMQTLLTTIVTESAIPSPGPPPTISG